MFPTKADFSVVERKNVHASKGKEWALNVSFDSSRYTLRTWTKKPTDKTIREAIDLTMRSFEVFYNSIRKPPFFSMKQSLVVK